MPSSLNPWRRFLMWRSGRGFGIHSPFAFRFVTEVLHQPCAYYAYAELGRDRTACLLVRLVAALQPRRVALRGVADSLRRALRLADSRIMIVDEIAEADLIVADCEGWSRAEISALFASEAPPRSMLVNCAHTPQLAGRGMTFANARGTIVVAALPHLPLQHFDLNF